MTGRVRTAGFWGMRPWGSLRRDGRIVGGASRRSVGARLPSAHRIQGRPLRREGRRRLCPLSRCRLRSARWRWIPRMSTGRTTGRSASPTSSRSGRSKARGLGRCLLFFGPVRPAITGGVGSLRLAWTNGCARYTPTGRSLFGPPRASATPCPPRLVPSFLSSASSAGGSASSRSRSACLSACFVWPAPRS